MSSSRWLYKYMSGALGIRYLLQNRTLRFTPPAELNDPFEGGLDATEMAALSEAHMCENGQSASVDRPSITADPAVRSEIRLAATISAWRVNQRYFTSNVGILCLSRRADSVRMWAQYGDNYSGLAVGFDPGSRVIAASTAMGLTGPCDVIYSSKRPKESDVDPEDPIAERLRAEASCLRKGPDWAYEEEVRCFKNSPSSHEGTPDIVEFDIDDVRDIVIGIRMKPAQIDDVYRFRAEIFPNATLRVAVPSVAAYSVTLHSAPREARVMKGFTME